MEVGRAGTLQGNCNVLRVCGCRERLGPAKSESQKLDIPLTLKALRHPTVAVKNLHLIFISPVTTHGHLVPTWMASGKA